MSKCRPTPTPTLLALESAGVSLSDVTSIKKDSTRAEKTERSIVITIPYDALRDEKAVQIAFQDLVTISTI